MPEPEATLILGDAGDMACIGSGTVQLVLTSPPFYPEAMRAELAAPRRRQVDPAAAWQKVERFSRTLHGVFREMARILGRAGSCCIQTKDLAYGEFRLPLAALHAQMAREAGLWVRCAIHFRNCGTSPTHLPGFVTRPQAGRYRTLESSTVWVCSHADWNPPPGAELALSRKEALGLADPHWRITPARAGRIHEHQSPPMLVRRLIELLSSPGDLVVDPFAGSAQVLRIARELGRRSIGYELDAQRHAAALTALAGEPEPVTREETELTRPPHSSPLWRARSDGLKSCTRS